VRTFYDWAAWSSFIAPLATPPLSVAAVRLAGRLGYYNFITPLLAGELIILALAILCGIIGLIGAGSHKRKCSIWMAILGILLSSGLGVVDWVILLLSSPNC